MHQPIKTKNKAQGGFSLVEVSIVIMILALIFGSGMALYHQYRVEKDWTETEKDMDMILNKIGGFRTVYGRYPCPASPTAAPGDEEYGHENADCKARIAADLGTCDNGVCTYASNNPGKTVLIGSLPFKILNLQESESYDSHLNRITYAVTYDLTGSDSVLMADGGISINDIDGNNLISPEHTAHFAIISHGPNKIGAYSKGGILSADCDSGSSAEEENCDADTTFVSAEVNENYDDRIGYFSSVPLDEWRVGDTETTQNDIMLKNTSGIAIGASTSDDLSTSDKTKLERNTIDEDDDVKGIVKTRNESKFYLDRLCTESASSTDECFPADLIAGEHEDMQCPEGQYLVKIAGKQAICNDEIFISCPEGDFVKGINNEGKIRCNTSTPNACYPEEITTSCGTSKTIGENDDGTPFSSGRVDYAYSGRCYMITDYDDDDFEELLEGLSVEEMYAAIDAINAETRTQETCDNGEWGSQIRDTYQCNNGEWNFYLSHETWNWWDAFPWYYYRGRLSEPGDINENPYENDLDNTDGYHDCWCREDYRITPMECDLGYEGTAYRIEKHPCPQTRHTWQTIDVTYQFCGCDEREEVETMSCNDYYEDVTGADDITGLTGNVYLTYDITCEDDEPIRSEEPSSVDTSECACAMRDDTVVREDCSVEGTTNSWSWSGGDETSVEALSVSQWICPETTTAGLPDPGYYDEPTDVQELEALTIPACVCDASRTQTVDVDCPSNLEGDGKVYLREWDCSLNDGLGGWEPEDEWELIVNDCKSCSWQPPSGSPSIEAFPYGGPDKEIGNTCNCGSGVSEFCWDYGSGGSYDVWTSCQCIVQED